MRAPARAAARARRGGGRAWAGGGARRGRAKGPARDRGHAQTGRDGTHQSRGPQPREAGSSVQQTQNRSDSAILYWVETLGHGDDPAVGTQIRLRFSRLHDDTGWSLPQDLSDPWTPTDDFEIGDYVRRDFLFDGQLNYLLPWPQPSGGKKGMRYRVVSVPALE